MRTVGERITYAMKLRDVPERGQNDLARRAGVGGGTFSRLKNDQIDRPNVEHLFRIAKALDVGFSWLAKGEGRIEAMGSDPPPDESGEVRVGARDRYPNRGLAALHARDYKISEAAVNAVLKEPIELASDMPLMAWLDRMRAVATLQEQERYLVPKAHMRKRAEPSAPGSPRGPSTKKNP